MICWQQKRHSVLYAKAHNGEIGDGWRSLRGRSMGELDKCPVVLVVSTSPHRHVANNKLKDVEKKTGT